MKEYFVDTWLVKGRKHRSVAMDLEQLQHASQNARLARDEELDVELQVRVIGDEGEKLVGVDDVWPAILKVSK